MADHTIPVLRRSIDVLNLIAENNGLTTKFISRTLGISHSTTYRILQTLEAADWVRLRDGGLYELSFGLLPLLQPLSRHEQLIETLREPVSRLGKETGLTVKITVRQGSNAITVFRTESSRPTSINVRSGASFHLALGSSGAVLLSRLNHMEQARLLDGAPKDCWKYQQPEDVYARIRELRERGLCTDFGNYRPGIHAMSAPVLNRQEDVVCALTLLGFAQDFEGGQKVQLEECLLRISAECSRLLSGSAGGGVEAASA